APGAGAGKTGTPSPETAGTPFTVTVNAVDANWNLVTATNTIAITSSDASAVLPANAALVAGSMDFIVTLKTAGSGRTVTATSVAGPAATANTSAGITVSAASVTKLAITSVNGGSNPTAGTAFSVIVQSQDSNGNATNVTAATAISLTLKTGAGALGGTLTGTINASANSVTISGLTYTKAESGVVLT